MPPIPIGISAHRRTLAQTPQIFCTNMFVEPDPTGAFDKFVRLQRPGLNQRLHVASGPVRGIFQQAGTFNSRYLVVSATTAALVDEAFTKTVLSGTVTGSSRVNMAANASRALIATGDILYSTEGTALSQVIIPDDLPISSVMEMNGYFLLTQTNSGRVWFIPPGGVNVDALDFFTIENSADNNVVCKRLGDEAWFFGEASIEVWVPTGNADLPFERVQGKLYTKGCANRDAVVSLDNTLFFVGTDKVVYRIGTVPERVSDHGIEERLRASDQSTYRAWAFSMDGHLFYVLTIGDEGTFAYDVATQQWHRFKSYGRETWRAHVGTQSSGSFIMAGDDTNGDLYTLEAGKSTDAGEPLERELMGMVPVLGRPVRCNSFSLFMASGQIDAGEEPELMLRWSDDNGNSWSDWTFVPLGRTGEYGGVFTARRLGMMFAPGRVFHVRYTHASVFRCSGAAYNEAWEARAA